MIIMIRIIWFIIFRIRKNLMRKSFSSVSKISLKNWLYHRIDHIEMILDSIKLFFVIIEFLLFSYSIDCFVYFFLFDLSSVFILAMFLCDIHVYFVFKRIDAILSFFQVFLGFGGKGLESSVFSGSWLIPNVFCVFYQFLHIERLILHY